MPKKNIRQRQGGCPEACRLLSLFCFILTGACLLVGCHDSRLTCKSYRELSTTAAQNLDPKRFEGTWYEVASRNVELLTNGCHCTHYNFTMTSDTDFRDRFICNKGSPTDRPTIHDVYGRVSRDLPGKMSEDLGIFGTQPYWVLNIWGAYEYALVYACAPVLGEFVYFFSRSQSMPADIRSQMKEYATSRGISLDHVKEVPMEGCSAVGQPGYNVPVHSVEDALNKKPTRLYSDEVHAGPERASLPGWLGPWSSVRVMLAGGGVAVLALVGIVMSYRRTHGASGRPLISTTEEELQEEPQD